MHRRVSQVLLQSLLVAERPIACLTLEGWGVDGRVPQVLLQSLFTAERSITVVAVERRSMHRRGPQVLLCCRKPVRRLHSTEHARVSPGDAGSETPRWRRIDRKSHGACAGESCRCCARAVSLPKWRSQDVQSNSCAGEWLGLRTLYRHLFGFPGTLSCHGWCDGMLSRTLTLWKLRQEQAKNSSIYSPSPPDPSMK